MERMGLFVKRMSIGQKSFTVLLYKLRFRVGHKVMWFYCRVKYNYCVERYIED